ncbi:type II toxin-antitoxin system VapC family toxin [Gloeobacter morelensis]|uniref:Ribonuclease VapC n=1 Tax=Gloeobacter morelensis MG652769 TaxID=2781736 RepID=A0ABY3PJZ9_9CYAN|nr:type II toxin-antitoxin system VapC family toxin [Gloeobacter morelensis]UFP93953.1 type II toxin-antitoxin system VapC family toxin [Gloeobacter morelensis MG652769]
MNGFLLDTNVISELRKPQCHPGVQAWSDLQPAGVLYLSAVTIAEIRFGIEQLPDPSRQAVLMLWLNEHLRRWFAGRILEVDEEVILEWRRMVGRGRAVGHTFSQPDLFIAATASVHGLCVATRNVRDFQIAQVAVYDPWSHLL